MKLLARIVSGDVPLWITFWVLYLLPNIVFKIIFDEYLNGPMDTYNKTIVYSAMVGAFLAIVYWIFAAVSVWRSATKYKGPQSWAAMAKFVVILTIFNAVGACATEQNRKWITAFSGGVHHGKIVLES